MDEIWVYTTTDGKGGEGVAYVETAGGTRIPLVAHTEEGARQYRPLAERMAQITGTPWTLRRYTTMTVIETVPA